MSETTGSDAAFRVADRLRVDGPWEVFGERARRFEIHLSGRTLEMVRGPIVLEGYGVRVFRYRNGRTGVGFQASSDLSDDGVRTVVSDAEATGRHSDFPAKSVELPTRSVSGADGVEVRDPKLWDHPLQSLHGYVDALLAQFDGKNDVTPSFGSVRATLIETSIANSAGLRSSYAHSRVDLEVAVKAFGGAEGAPPGEYWVNEYRRRLEPDLLPGQVAEWCQYARDVRRSTTTPTGELPVVLPAAVLSGILPVVFGARFTGAARLREVAPSLGSKLGADELTLHDDGRVPWAPGSAPVDDEGTPERRRTLLSGGTSTELLYDLLHAGAFEVQSTGNAIRGPFFSLHDWHRFTHSPRTGATTLVLEPGGGGSDAELVEAADEGIWLQQLGWAIPDPFSGAFGGEVRIGYRIRHGKLAEPIRGGTIGGVVLAPPGTPSMLTNFAAIGSRATLAETVLAPSVLVKPLTVAGPPT